MNMHSLRTLQIKSVSNPLGNLTGAWEFRYSTVRIDQEVGNFLSFCRLPLHRGHCNFNLDLACIRVSHNATIDRHKGVLYMTKHLRCMENWATSWYEDIYNQSDKIVSNMALLIQVQHAKRTQALGHLPPYQSEIVRAVTKEVRDLDRDVNHLLEPFGGSFNPSAEPATACALLVDHLCMRRNKRCLLAYHRVRSDKLEEMCWSGMDVLEEARATAQPAPSRSENSSTNVRADTRTTNSLSPEEEEYVRQYGDLLAACKGQWTEIDLTGSLEPPRDLFIDVRVLKDAGEIQTEYG